MSGRKETLIRMFANQVGFAIESIRWQPLGKDHEMMGRSGGWIVNGESIGHNAKEAIDFIRVSQNNESTGPTTRTFHSIGYDFSAMTAAENWCKENGISVGRMQGPSPRGLLRGDFDIAKWRNLSKREKAELHGQMTGNMRNGPVTVEMF
jgi:hypothetical protein